MHEDFVIGASSVDEFRVQQAEQRAKTYLRRLLDGEERELERENARVIRVLRALSTPQRERASLAAKRELLTEEFAEIEHARAWLTGASPKKRPSARRSR